MRIQRFICTKAQEIQQDFIQPCCKQHVYQVVHLVRMTVSHLVGLTNGKVALSVTPIR